MSSTAISPGLLSQFNDKCVNNTELCNFDDQRYVEKSLNVCLTLKTYFRNCRAKATFTLCLRDTDGSLTLINYVSVRECALKVHAQDLESRKRICM